MRTIQALFVALVLTGVQMTTVDIALARGGGGGGAHFAGGGGHFGERGQGHFEGFHGRYGTRRLGGYEGRGDHHGYWYPGPFGYDYGFDGYDYLNDYPDGSYNDENDSGLSTASVAATSTEITLSVQKELAQLGYYQGPLDGVRGPETEAAVRKFQSVDKLPVTGQIDRATLKALSVS